MTPEGHARQSAETLVAVRRMKVALGASDTDMTPDFTEDFVWRVEDGRIADNPVSVDFASVMAQLGHDVCGGEGWEANDTGAKEPPKNPEM